MPPNLENNPSSPEPEKASPLLGREKRKRGKKTMVDSREVPKSPPKPKKKASQGNIDPTDMVDPSNSSAGNAPEANPQNSPPESDEAFWKDFADAEKEEQAQIEKEEEETMKTLLENLDEEYGAPEVQIPPDKVQVVEQAEIPEEEITVVSESAPSKPETARKKGFWRKAGGALMAPMNLISQADVVTGFSETVGQWFKTMGKILWRGVTGRSQMDVKDVWREFFGKKEKK